MKIFNLDEFIIESGAAYAERSTDKYSVDSFTYKRGGTILARQRDKKEKILEEIGEQISQKYKWLVYGINRDNQISSRKWASFDRVLFIYYSSVNVMKRDPVSYNNNRHRVINNPNIPFADLGINAEQLTETQWDDLRSIREIEICDDKSFKLNVNQKLYDRFSKFMLDNYKNEIKSHKFMVAYDDKDGDEINNDNNFGLILCDWDRVSGNRQTLETMANQVVDIFIEFIRSLFPIINK